MHRQQQRQYSNQQYLQSTSIGITDTIFKQSFCILSLPTATRTLLHEWRSLFKLRHYTTRSTAFTNLTTQL